MDSNQVVGLVFLALGILDPAVGFFVVGPRLKDDRQRRIVVGGLALAGLAFATLGTLLLAGLLKLQR